MKIVKDLNFAEFRSELFHTLDNIKEIVLSTTSQNRVTSRVVSCACYGPKIYFLSWDHHTKCRQIRENPQVALCHETLQLEGIAKIKGDALATENQHYAEKYRAKQPRIFDLFTPFEGMTLVEVTITSITSYPIKETEDYYLDHIDFSEGTAFRSYMKRI